MCKNKEYFGTSTRKTQQVKRRNIQLTIYLCRLNAYYYYYYYYYNYYYYYYYYYY